MNGISEGVAVIVFGVWPLAGVLVLVMQRIERSSLGLAASLTVLFGSCLVCTIALTLAVGAVFGSA